VCVGNRCLTQRSCPLGEERGCGLVDVAGGGLQLGSSETSTAEPLLGRVTLSAMVVDAHEVTVARFRRYWGAGHPAPTMPVRYPNGITLAIDTVREPVYDASGMRCNWSATAPSREVHPINCVDWSTAMAFCAWDGARLPTEAEFEFLSRARPVSGLPVPRRYPWGDEDPPERSTIDYTATRCTIAQFVACLGDDGAWTRRVGSFPASGGLFDLSGNVKEWAADGHAYYGSSPCWGPTPVSLQDPVCPAGLGTRMLRGGGSRAVSSNSLLGASRDMRAPTDIEDDTGFRCVRSP
jgi:formylglycine-generating enzyme required for sulfatase activity